MAVLVISAIVMEMIPGIENEKSFGALPPFGSLISGLVE
jgi:hypothetical protein